MVRRTLLKGAAAAAAARLGGTPAARGFGAGTGPLSPAPAGEVPGAEFDALRRRWRRMLLGTGFDPADEPFAGRLAALGTAAAALRGTMAPAPTAALWADLPLGRCSSHLTASYARLHTMAQAWARSGTGVTGQDGLLRAVTAGLRQLHRQAYHEQGVPYGNWWDWQIGSARLSLDILVLVHGRLAPARLARYLAAVDRFVPAAAVACYAGTSTGANRAELCRVLAVRGALGRDAARIALARDALSPVFRPVTAGDGLYRDGSFIQHADVPYTGTYGAVLLDAAGRLLVLLDGSRWQITDPRRERLFDAVERTYAPFLHNGLMMDAVSGRAVSREWADDHTRGHAVLAGIARLAQVAGPARRTRWHGLLNGWIARERYRPVLTDPSPDLADLALLHSVARGGAAPLPEPRGHRLFPAMDRAVHRAPGWTAALSMCSRRTAYYETGNGENLRGWHTGAGMLQWWAGPATDGQYSDGFWPTVDPYRLPGTTVSAKRLADGAGGPWGAARPDAAFAGGATDGRYAVLGQQLRGLGSTLTACRSWLFLDDAVVCLGAGISARDGTAVETVVDNRMLDPDGTAALTVDGVLRTPAAAHRSTVFRAARWAHLAGHGGWLFPGGTALTVLREERTGSWRSISTAGSAAPVSRRWLTLLLDHGVDPDRARCGYVLMPGASAAAVARRAADRGWLRVLANTATTQGVAVPALGVTAVNFFAAGTAGRLSADGPASVLVRASPGGATIRVADPTGAGRELNLRLGDAHWRISPGAGGITVTNSTATTR